MQSGLRRSIGSRHLDAEALGGAQGLAEDVRYYGQWMRDEAVKRIGHLYPKVKITAEMAQDRPDLKEYVGQERTVIAWLWTRTVASPNPAARGAHVPVASSFMLSRKQGRKVWVELVRDEEARDGWSFRTRSGQLSKEAEDRAKLGTRAGKAQDFLWGLTGVPITRTYIQAEGKAGRLGERLMAVVADGGRGRVYLSPQDEFESPALAATTMPIVVESRDSFLSGAIPTRAMITGGVCSAYGLRTWGHLFTARQLVALMTFSDLVAAARAKVLSDARGSGLWPDSSAEAAWGSAFQAAWNPIGPEAVWGSAFQAEVGPEAQLPTQNIPLADGGSGPQAYADAVATYLAFAVSGLSNRSSKICSWDSSRDNVRSFLRGRHCL